LFAIAVPINGDLRAIASVEQSALPTTLGTDFFISFSGQSGSLRALYLSSTEDATAVIYWPNGSTQSASVSAGLVTTVDATTKVSAIANDAEVISNQTARVVSDVPISLYYINYISASTDASSAIPSESLGRSYVVMSYRPSSTTAAGASRMNIIATEPGTTSVTITPTVDLVGNRTASQSFVVELAQGQAFSSIPSNKALDLSGTLVIADKKVSVMSSTYLFDYNIAGTARANDAIFEQMVPIEAWGTNYVLAMSPGAASTQKDLYRVFASEDNTALEVNGTQVAILDRGEWYEFDSTNTGAKADLVSASAPVGIMQYLRGSIGGYRNESGGNNQDGDPAMISVPSTTQFLTDYVVTTPASGFALNMIVLIAPQSSKGSITLDGDAIPSTRYVDIPSTSFAVARVEVSLGSHYIRNAEPFGLAVMGFTDADSYAYAGGFGLVESPGGYVAALNNAPPTAPFSAGGDTLTGLAAPCGTMTISEGTWTDGRSTLLATEYKWLRNGELIGGETGLSYAPSSGDIGALISAEIKKTNAIGTTTTYTPARKVSDLRLSALSSSGQSPAPSLGDCVTSYSFATSEESVTFSADVLDPEVGIRINGFQVLPGQGSLPFAMSLGSNSLTLETFKDNQTFSRVITIVRTTDPLMLPDKPDLQQTQATIKTSVIPNANLVANVQTYLALDAGFSSGLVVLNNTPGEVSGSAAVLTSTTFTGLSMATKYFTKTVADFGGTQIESQTSEFMTLAAPTVETQTSAQQSSASAKLTLLINLQSQALVFAGFDVSTDPEMQSGVSRVSASYDNFSGPPARYAATVTGLPAGQKIYYRAVGSNASGTNSGVIKSFTLTAAPEGTLSATVTGNNVDFMGSLNSFGSRTSTFIIRYGKSSSLASGNTDVIPVPGVIESTTPKPFTAQVRNLEANTTYYARLLSSSTGGSLAGPIISFTTGAPAAPSVDILSSTAVNPEMSINVYFSFSEPVTAFSKAGVSLGGQSAGWTTQPVRAISQRLYSMEIRPSSPATGSLVVEVASGAGISLASQPSSPASISISVVAGSPTTFSFGVSSLTLFEGQALQPISPVLSGTSPSLFSAVPPLPAGLALSSQGLISGTPASGTAGNSTHVIRALGGVGTPEVSLTIQINTAAQMPNSNGSATVESPSTINTPEILSFSTRELPQSGGQITAEGRRLADISSMTLGGIRVTIVSNTDTSVTFTVLEMPLGTWDLRLVGANGTLTFQQAITIVGEKVVLESTPGTMLGFTMTLRFTGNNRTLNVVQERNLTGKLDRFSTAETIICWGYTTAANPNAWAIAHATARAKAACDFAVSGDSSVKSVVRLRYGESKDFAMRAALQFWR
jgi:hypothetical protein